MSWTLIVNPSAGNGRGARVWNKIKPLLEQGDIPFETRISNYPGHILELADAAYREGSRQFIVLGGDGSVHEVINGVYLHRLPAAERVTIAMLPVGTGNDWIKTTGSPRDAREMIRRLPHAQRRAHDLGILTYGESQKKRCFVNIAGLGYDGYVTERAAHYKGFFAGTKLSYWQVILGALFHYKKTRVTIRVDGAEITRDSINLAAGNGRFNGGGMMQLPEALMDDGLLDMSIINDMSSLQMALNVHRMLNGSFVKLKQVETFRGRHIYIASDPPVWLEADGEVLGKTPVDIHIDKQRFDVLV